MVFLSGKDRRPTNGNIHTSFKLGTGGEYFGLFNGESPRQVIDEIAPRYPRQRADFFLRTRRHRRVRILRDADSRRAQLEWNDLRRIRAGAARHARTRLLQLGAERHAFDRNARSVDSLHARRIGADPDARNAVLGSVPGRRSDAKGRGHRAGHRVRERAPAVRDRDVQLHIPRGRHDPAGKPERIPVVVERSARGLRDGPRRRRRSRPQLADPRGTHVDSDALDRHGRRQPLPRHDRDLREPLAGRTGVGAPRCLRSSSFPTAAPSTR